MQRRKFVIGMGALASGAAAAMGTGAFSFARAERDITVDTTGDASAYLGLEAEDNQYATYNDGGQLELDFSELNDNADTRFDNVFAISNNGENDANITFHDEEGESSFYDSPIVTWYYSEEPDFEGNEVNDDDPLIESGESIYIHVVFSLTEDYDQDDIPDHLGISADAN